MISRRIFLIALGMGALAAPLTSFAQQRAALPLIIFLAPGSFEGKLQKGWFEAFRQGLREIGYIEGQNIAIEWRFTKGKADLFPELAAELAGLKVACIVANGTTATRAARQATKTIPIVMVNTIDDPVRLGLVANIARPGGNVTGFTNISSALAGKRLELFKETLPKASRMAILWDPDSLRAAGDVKATEIAARALGVQLQSLEVRNPEALANAFRAAGKGRAQALIIMAIGFMNSHRTRVVNLVAKTRLPVMYSLSEFVPLGGLMSYAANVADQHRLAATYVDKILNGANPGDLPVQQPTKFELLINMKTAKALGIKIPQSILVQATKVIE